MAVVSKDVSIAFKLINATVNVHSALLPKQSNVTVCAGSHGGEGHAPMKISQVRKCEQCGEVAYADLRRARETPNGLVMLADQDLVEAKTDAGQYKKRASLTPHPRTDVDTLTVAGEKLYYLEPRPGSEDSYAVLRHLVTSHPEMVFTCLWTPRSNASIFVLQARGDVLVLQERVRTADTAAPPPVNADAPQQLLALAEQLLSLDEVVPFDPDLYADSFEDNLRKLLDGKAPVELGASPGGDLMQVLTEYMSAQVKKPAKKKKVSSGKS